MSFSTGLCRIDGSSLGRSICVFLCQKLEFCKNVLLSLP
jgi:hypothetical protein